MLLDSILEYFYTLSYFCGSLMPLSWDIFLLLTQQANKSLSLPSKIQGRNIDQIHGPLSFFIWSLLHVCGTICASQGLLESANLLHRAWGCELPVIHFCFTLKILQSDVSKVKEQKTNAFTRACIGIPLKGESPSVVTKLLHFPWRYFYKDGLC